jgi:flagellar hook protein FlgE
MEALAIAAAGMTVAANRLNASAQRVASSDAHAEKVEDLKDVDYVKERVEQISAQYDFKANAKVIQTADQMAGALLNIKA